MNQYVQNQELVLTQLNQMKKNPEQRKLQNKRYREKNREMLNLKKQLTYHTKKHNTLLIFNNILHSLSVTDNSSDISDRSVA
jgi:hypothetical protein